MSRYLVFGRTAYADPLTQRGELDAPGDPRDAARRQFGEDWVELSLVPEAAVHWILRADGDQGSRRGRDADY